MVKTPKTRHSRSRREPVTIELEPGAVSRVVAEPEAAGAAETPGPEASAEEAEPPQDRAPEADFEPREPDEAATASETPPPGGFDYGFDETPPKAEVRPEAGAAAPDKAAPAAGAASGRAERKRGGAGAFAAGIVGGVIALAGAGALQYAGLLGAPGGTAASGIDGQIADLRSQVTALANAGDGGLGAKVDGLSKALDQVRADVTALQGADAGGGAAALSALSDKVGEIEKTVAALGSNETPADLGPLNEKLAALDALVKSGADAAADQQGRLAALEQSVSQLSAKVDAQAAQPKIALAIAASALKAALDRGAPFAAELDTFAAIAPDAPQFAALRAYAEKGVPTRIEIAGRMDAAANAMIAAATPVDTDAGFLQRLVSSAESLVKVRPVGTVEGTGVPETVARMEVAVNQGDYAKALAEYGALPDAAKAAGADFAGLLKARLDVEAGMDALISAAMKG